MAKGRDDSGSVAVQEKPELMKSHKFMSVAQEMFMAMYGDQSLDREGLSDLELRVYDKEPKFETTQSTGGRPRKVYEFADGKQYPVDMYRAAEKNIADKKVMSMPEHVGLQMNEVEFMEFCRLAMPQIGLRMVAMASVSEDLKEVKSVFECLADRGYGKPTQAVEVTDPNKDIRAGWIINVSDDDAQS